MNRTLVFGIAAFVVVDLLVTARVLRRFFKKRMAQAGLPPTLDLHRLREFTDVVHPRVGEYLNANWDRRPETLPGVLSALLEQIAGVAREQKLELDRDVLKRLLQISVAKHQIARSGVLREALKQVA